MKKSKKNNNIEIVDNKPVWPPMKNQIKGAIRRIFRLSPWMKLTLQKARVEKDRVLKDGTVSTKPDVYYRCAACQGLFKQKDVQVDHIEPVITPGKTVSEMTYDEIVDRIFCPLDNLQVLCKTCHAKKTKQERSKPSRVKRKKERKK